MGGILTIAIADAFSDALGIHVSEESENRHSTKEIWESTIATFLAKFFFAMTFLIPLFIFKLRMAIIVSLIWGFFCMGLFSYILAKEQKVKAWVVVAEHWIIGMVVVVSTHFVGELIAKYFGST